MKTKANDRLINIVTLGCSKNLVDTEKLMRQLDANGLRIIHNDNSSQASTVIINTCGFIKDAKQESIDTILQFIKAKERGDIRYLYVMGCLSQRYKEDLKKEISEVDQYFGTNSIQEVVRALGYSYRENLIGERLLTTPSHYAYLKISEGCDRRCSFCAIPMIRGKYQSYPIENLVEEAKILIRQGVREIILIAQDLSYYGMDLYREQKLPDLLTQLAEIKNLEWIRLHYAFPAGFPMKVLQVMKQYKNICNYLDIPFQHISDVVLKNMCRGINQEQTYALINTLRNLLPDLTLRTSLMVGHPGEDSQQFDELVKFVKEVRFDRLGIFTYSEEEDTFSALTFSDSIPEKLKKQRAKQIMTLQQDISHELNQKKVGTKMNVIIDRSENGCYIGRTEGDSPDIDNEVIIRSKQNLTPGKFYTASITEAHDYDLEAVI